MKNKQSKYGLAVTVDFTMDLISGAFDRDSLKKLFALYRSWGIERIDWIDRGRHEDGFYTHYWLYQYALDNACQTYEAIGEYLPAVVDIAHELGMTCHAIFNPFDRAFNYSLFKPEQGKIGLTDLIDGAMGRATRSFLALQHCRMERNMRLVPKNAEKMVLAKIVLQADGNAPHDLTPNHLKLETSPDNDVYQSYQGPINFTEKSVRGHRVIELSGLSIRERYVVIRTPFKEGAGTFANTLDRLVRLYDPTGSEIPFTYGLDSNADRNRRFVKRRRHMGTKIAANAWQIGDCLDAGVDGVDIRIDNHARSQEWDAYGFEEPVACEYRRRWGVDLRHGVCDLRRLSDVRAGHFTAFIRQASQQVRGHGRKFQAHITGGMMRRTAGQRYMGMKWEWEKWLSEGLLDGVTMKQLDPQYPDDGGRLCAALNRRAAADGTPVWYVNFSNVFHDSPDGAKRFARLLKYSLSHGHAGMNIYESSTLVRKRGRRFHIHHPELLPVLAECQAIK